jgi:predicted permease
VALAFFRDALWLRWHREAPDPAEWRRARRLGGETVIPLGSDGGKGDSLVSRLSSDLRFALRRVVKTPRYAALVTIILALGIGATITVASILETVLLRPLPYANATGIVRALAFDAGKGQLDWISWREVQAFREAKSFDRVAASTIFPAVWNRDGGSIRVQRGLVSENYFELLGVGPRLGASLALTENTVVVSHRLWRQELGSSPDVLGRGMNLDGKVYEIQAVAPEALYDHDLGSANADVWISQSLDRSVADPDFRVFTLFGRLESGADRLSAELELSGLEGGLASVAPELYSGWQVRVEGLRESMVEHLRPALVLLLGAVFLILLIVTTNLSNLVLTRTLARRRELAIHVALGARAPDVARSVAVETFLLALVGGALGILVSRVALGLLSTVSNWPLPRQVELLLEPPRILTPLAISLVAALLVGMAPSLAALRSDLASPMASSARGSTGASRWRGVVIAVQVALSVPLVLGAALLTRSVSSLEHHAVGLTPDRILSVRVSLPREWIGSAEPANLARVARFFDETIAEARTLPEVLAAGASTSPPFLGDADRARYQIAGEPALDPAKLPRALLHAVTPGYFETLGTKLVDGRLFDSRDADRATAVAIVSAELARRSFPGVSPLGRSITTEWTFGPGAPSPRIIVGVVEDIAQLGPTEPVEPQIYVPHAQAAFPSLALVVQTSGSEETLVRALQKQVSEREPLAVVERATTLRDALSASLHRPRFYARFLGVVAVAAAGLFALGLYGLLSFRVASQHRELGLRAALGATPGTLLAFVLESGLSVSGAGFAVGALIALALARLLSSLVYGISVYDPWTLAATTTLILATTLAASWLPARRAARVSIVEALRLDE